MKKNPLLPALLLLPLLVGCANQKMTPTRQVIAAQDTYSTTLQVLTEFRKAGKISDAQAVRIEELRIVAANALDLAKLRAREGSISPSDALAAFYKAISDINALLPQSAERNSP